MKNSILLFAILFLLSFNIAEAQTPTDAGIPDAYHVLVVYNSLDQTSIDIKDYYQNARGIPESNIVLLELPDSIEITIDNETHWVGLAQETDIIRDFYQDAIWAVTPTKHAFKYFLDNIATPIKTHLVNNNLLSTVRYILLVKGVPSKVQSGGDWCCDVQGNVTVGGLLCMLNTPNYNSFILNDVFYKNGRTNPYKNIDPYFSMEYRFLPDHFIANEGHHLSYLVSHLDGISYEIVKGIIDRSIDPDMSGTAYWIIDNEPNMGGDFFIGTRDKLLELGFNVYYDDSDTWVTSYPEKVMGYTSWGTHAEDGNCEWEDSAWVKDSLKFDLANGSVFNTIESFNGNSLTTLEWRYVPNVPPACHHTQGLATQFTEIGGTGTMGHAWEPKSGGVVENQIFFPAYQIGYNLVDAFYQGLPALAWQNVLVADPLVRIFECENTVITTNTTIGSGDYQCNIIVPQNVILTIAPGSTVNFSRNAELKIYGTLVINSNDTLNFNSYSKLMVESTGSVNIASDAYINFNNHSNLIINNLFTLVPNAYFNFNDNSILLINNSFTISYNSQLHMNDNSAIKQNGNLFVAQNAFLIMNDYSGMENFGILFFNDESNFNLNNSAQVNSYGKIYFSEGSTLNLNNSNVTALNIKSGVFVSTGSENNPANINCSSMLAASKLYFNNLDTLIFLYTNIDSGHIVFDINDGEQKPRLYSISNSVITNSASINIFSASYTEEVNINLSDNYFSCDNNNGIGMTFSGFNNVQIIRNTIENIGSVSDVGIGILNNKSMEIIGCDIIGFKDGIKQGRIGLYEIDITNIEDIRVFNSDIIGIGYDQEGTGISIGYNPSNTTGVKIDQNNISGFSSGIVVNNDDDFALGISNNTITNYGSFGISVSNGSEAVIKENIISVNEPGAESCVGISVNLVNNPSILGNTIDADGVSNPGPGISLVSCNISEIRRNTIQNHLHGIEIGSSSPNLAENSIMNNKYYGMYVSNGSYPNLSETTSGEYTYPLTGYNIIRENGLCGNDNAEIYFNHAGANLHLGCNTVADDRENSGQCDYTLLMDGIFAEGEIAAEENYWGNHPVYGHDPSERFGNEISVIYDPYLEEPCTYSPGEEFLVLKTSEGEIIDTVYSSGIASMNLPDLESRYKAANGYYYNNQYLLAKQEYEGITQNYENSKGSLQAYNRLYTIAKLTNSPPEAFNQLKDFYLQKAGNQTDSLMVGTLKHLSDLCLVAAKEYLPAINNFDQIAQQNPNTDIALYRQIDALTTSLLVPKDSTLNKGILGKYSVNNLSDYTSKLSALLKTRGKSGLKSEAELIPTEYTLYQNYPNPFNPTTTIKYDLPYTSDVSLIIYDILGRKIKELVNSKQQAGRYEVRFDASNLASGVYIYQLIAEKYMNSKKMILLR